MPSDELRNEIDAASEAIAESYFQYWSPLVRRREQTDALPIGDSEAGPLGEEGHGDSRAAEKTDDPPKRRLV